jgi:hypothetical protein
VVSNFQLFCAHLINFFFFLVQLGAARDELKQVKERAAAGSTKTKAAAQNKAGLWMSGVN